MPRRKLSFLTLGRAVQIRLLSISVWVPELLNSFEKESWLAFFFIALYLILDVAVGGTNGWFPDGAGNKPWLNGALCVLLLTWGLTYHWPLYMYLNRCHANFRTGRGQVVQDMAFERRRSRDEDVRHFDSFENCADRFDAISDYVKMWERCWCCPHCSFDFLEGQVGREVIPRHFDHLLFLLSFDFSHCH